MGVSCTPAVLLHIWHIAAAVPAAAARGGMAEAEGGRGSFFALDILALALALMGAPPLKGYGIQYRELCTLLYTAVK